MMQLWFTSRETDRPCSSPGFTKGSLASSDIEEIMDRTRKIFIGHTRYQ